MEGGMGSSGAAIEVAGNGFSSSLSLRSTERTNGRAFLPASHFKAPPPATSSLRFHFPTFFFVQPAELDRPHTLSAFKLWK
jgi:hypothetical protein